MPAHFSRPTVRLHEALLFARNYLKNPKLLGSLIPSSRFLVRRMLNRIDWANAKVIVEYGPGVGVFTTEILRRMRPDAILIAIDLHDQFVDLLRQNITDPRCHIVHGSAAEVGEVLAQHHLTGADCIISCIPLTNLPPDVLEQILVATHTAIGSNGMFLAFQYSAAVLQDVRQVFREVKITFEPLNVLPALVFICRT